MVWAIGRLCGCQCIMPCLVDFGVIAFGVQCNVQCCLGNVQFGSYGEIDCVQLM